MKNIFTLFFFVSVLLNSVVACEIEIEVDPLSKREVYKPNDEVVVIVTITHEHRKCELKIGETEFRLEALKILATTDWKEISDGVYQRKMKVQIVGSKTGKSVFKTIRTCSKKDSEGILRLNSTPINSNQS